MSVMLALKQNDHVYVACDSMIRRGDTQVHADHPSNYRVFKLKGSEHSVGCAVSSIIDFNIMKCNQIIGENKDVNYDNLVLEIIPRMFGILDERHLLYTKDDSYEMNTSWIFANEDSIFEVSPEGCLVEHPKYIAIGSPCEVVLGSLASTEDIKDPLKRIDIAMKAALNRDIYVSYPIIVMDTKTCEYTLIKE